MSTTWETYEWQHKPTLYIENVGCPDERATVYEPPKGGKHVIRIRLHDERTARFLADLFNEGKREEVLFRLASRFAG